MKVDCICKIKKTILWIYTLNDIGNSNNSKLESPPSNQYPLSYLELEE